MKTAVLLLAAGRGERLGGLLPKAFVGLAGRPLVTHSLETLLACPAIDWVQPLVSEAGEPHWQALVVGPFHNHPKLLPVVGGGAERQDSVAAGLAALPNSISHVLVHDCARPFVYGASVERLVAMLDKVDAAILASPLADTLKRVEGERIHATLARQGLYSAQTPQAFRLSLLREAHAKAKADRFLGTDDASLVERLGVKVAICNNSSLNFKITTAEDLALAEAWCAREQKGTACE